MDRSNVVLLTRTSEKYMAGGEADFILRTGGLASNAGRFTESDGRPNECLLVAECRLTEIRDGVRGSVEKRF